MAMFSFNDLMEICPIWSVFLRSESDLDFVTSPRMTFLYPNSWTVKLFLPSDNPNKTELSHNRVQNWISG